MKKIILALAIVLGSVTVGGSEPVNAGLTGCSWWYTYEGPYAKRVAATALCTGSTPGGTQNYRIKAYCSNGVVKYGMWRIAGRTSYVSGATCSHPDQALHSASISYSY